MADKEIEVPNDRSVHVLTNNDREVNPLIIVLPQWSKGSISKMPKARQEAIYDQFSEDVSVAFEKLLREVP
jgi:hypothetical protein